MNLWAFCRHDLGLDEHDTWELTMRELQALRRRWQNAHDWANYRAATVCCTLANLFRGKNTRAYSPKDFMPADATRKRQQTPEEMFQAVRQLHRAHGGE